MYMYTHGLVDDGVDGKCCRIQRSAFVVLSMIDWEALPDEVSDKQYGVYINKHKFDNSLREIEMIKLAE